MMGVAHLEEAKAQGGALKPGDGVRLASLEERTRDADTRLSHLEAQSQHLREDVDMLAEATGGLRKQSAKMREAALRVAQALTLARQRKSARHGQGRSHQPEKRPPRT